MTVSCGFPVTLGRVRSGSRTELDLAEVWAPAHLAVTLASHQLPREESPSAGEGQTWESVIQNQKCPQRRWELRSLAVTQEQ